MIHGLARLLVAMAGITAFIGAVPASTAAQESTAPTTVVEVTQLDLDNIRSGRNQDGVETARGDPGDTITYTSVDSPESSLGDATTADSTVLPMPPDLSRVPAETDSGGTTVVPPSGEPASAPVDIASPDEVAGDATTAEAAGAPVVAACADFPTWYDAQIYYESAGSAIEAPELAASLDPDFDGVACEEIMQLT